MPKRSLHAVLLFTVFSLNLALFPWEAFAGDCDMKGATIVTPQSKRQFNLVKSVDKYWQGMKSAGALTPPNDRLLFVIPDSSGENPTVYSVKVESNGAVQALPKEILEKLSRAPEVQLHNKTTFGSLYFMPFSEEGLKGINPLTACASARSERRYATAGCSTLNLKGLETITLLYDQNASSCDKIADVQRNASTRSGEVQTESEEKLVAEANRALHKNLKIIAGMNRRPAGLERPVYADKTVEKRTEKKLDVESTGAPAKSGTVKKSGGL